MNQVATHFAPTPWVQLPNAGVTAPPVISVTAMAGVSALVRDAFGEKVLRQAKQAVMLDIELIEEHECFIPQVTMTGFLWEIERRSGESNLGLFTAPHLSLTTYGRWGEYVMAANTLGAAIARAASTLGYHSTGDRMQITVEAGMARASYFNAMRGRAGYAHVASGTAGVLLSLLRAYLGPDFLPRQIELDIPRPAASTPFEDAFLCPVLFDAAAVSVYFDSRLLDRQVHGPYQSRLVTVEDVARVLKEPVDLNDLLGVVTAHIRAQVQTGVVTIDSTARALGTSVRTLQRVLRRDGGADFRELVNFIRMRRAKELLDGSNASIAEIATEFGYSTPANFARAFRKATGLAPQEYRTSRPTPTRSVVEDRPTSE
ncbi:AraC family transcriptional regulator [Variovorax ginsengisoli]|uniref:AraC family transcriptional regulator ligand-binding domain-containing protein n=1 Tax=Variovorax ginsengisoli TaxID=363844 RepID=A0ABT8S0W2_9BURK|nr:AraC family transcriptional regulator [Variovorax ginsengisoli]MDN8613384.1 AraC family transcriptional regulator ligand-binding domain-containing protein [Variovorax ginsengisoli]MDO1532554.1 AraC family transcriptional regulator ligand-binding domain-containing protein [Variovorax ginsengisoli]